MMIAEDIKRMIANGEGLLIEFKEAKDAVPSNFYDTVTSFSNTDGGTSFDNDRTDTVNRNGTNLPDKARADIQTLITIGKDKVPTWHDSGTNLLHKTDMYFISHADDLYYAWQLKQMTAFYGGYKPKNVQELYFTINPKS